jgi:group I intron endonuclease
MNIGIYYILNTVSKRVYVGSSKQIEKRLGQHEIDLNKDQHCNIHLQRAWHKYPHEVFKFGILELTARKDLLLVEQEYLDVNDGGYNIAPSAGGDCISHHPENAAIRKRISEEQIKRNAAMTVTERKETYGRPRSGENNSFYNKRHTEETKQILREKMSGDNSWIKDIDPAKLPYTKHYKITYASGATKEVAGLKIIAEEFNTSIVNVHATIGRIKDGKLPKRGIFANVILEEL